MNFISIEQPAKVFYDFEQQELCVFRPRAQHHRLDCRTRALLIIYWNQYSGSHYHAPRKSGLDWRVSRFNFTRPCAFLVWTKRVQIAVAPHRYDHCPYTERLNYTSTSPTLRSDCLVKLPPFQWLAVEVLLL